MSNAPFSLGGKTVLITGASSGIGRACALAAAAAGAAVALNGRDLTRLEQTAASLEGGSHSILAGDLLLPEERDRIVAQTQDGLDGIVLSSGIHRIKPAKFLNAAAVDETFGTNYNAPLLLLTALLKAGRIRQGASVIFIGSISANSATMGNALYAGSKGALIATSRILALELARLKVRVNVVSPGQVQTAMTDKNAEHLSPEVIAQNKAAYPLGEGTVTDVANAVLFLLLPMSSWVTGHDLVVDGGYTLR